MTDRAQCILLVDDVEANLVALEALLGDMKCEFVRASSGNEALRQLLKREFAVVLLDVQMPGMDGFEVARLARQHPGTRDVPIIFVTAMNASEESSLRGYETGAVDLLFKPINGYVLRSKVHVFLELDRSRRKLADEIEAHKKTLADMEAFNYSVSHDLRAPLRRVDGFSQILLESQEARLDEEAKGHLRVIRGAAQRMGQLIDDLLRLSKISRAEIKRRDVDLSALGASIFTELRNAEPAREVTTSVAPDIRVNADAGLLQIAIENLLRNAWKFTRGAARAAIEHGTEKQQGEAVFFVRDDGVGFDPTYAGKLFQPFRRLHSEEQFEGTGIGLAIVRRIIEHHGGRIWVESTPGKGATFFFTLARAPGSKL
jgi:two-component system, sensor histidine kinase and response regulator